MSKNLIRDGYTKRGYIAASDRLHDGLEFTYRPLLPEEVEATDAEISKAKPREAIRMIAALVAKQLETWSEVDEQGNAVPASAENVRRLPYPVLGAVHRIVAGMLASDPLPEPTDDETDELVAQLLESSNGQELMEADRKN